MSKKINQTITGQGRRNLKRNCTQEIFVDVGAHSGSDYEELYEGLDSDFSDESSSEDEASDTLYNEPLSEDENNDPLNDECLPEDALCMYENNERLGYIDLSGNWSQDVKHIRQFPFSTDPKGVIKIDITNKSTPRDVFDKIFTEDITEMIVNATNEYGRELYARPVPSERKSPKVNFYDTDATEMYKFFGLALLMGQCKFPTIRNAFSKHPLYYHPVFPATMSGRRYQMLLRTFNCHTPFRKDEKQDKLVKVNRLIDAIIQSFQNAYTPTKDLSLDESLLLFRGRLSFRQYIKIKSAKYGVNFYELTTSDGYVLNMIIYQGKDSNSANKGKKTQKIVQNLMEPYLNKGHHLFMDNFYNSITLSNYLLSNETHTTGTLRKDRKYNPKDVIDAKLKKGEIIWRRNGEVYVTKWKDKRDVVSITTAHHPELVETPNRFGKLKMKPKDVADYNKNMGGVDRLDQMTSYYSSPRKTIRWYKKVLLHVLDMAVWNSYFLYRRFHTKTSFLQFRDSLIMSMIQMPNTIREGRQLEDLIQSSGRPISNIGEPFVEMPEPTNLHCMEKIPVPSTHVPSYFQRCKKCAEKKMRKETCHRCNSCPGKPAMCPPCFKKYHE